MKRLKKLAALVASTLLTTSLFVGCGGSNAGENGTINFFNVGDYIDEALIRKFEKETEKVQNEKILCKIIGDFKT